MPAEPVQKEDAKKSKENYKNGKTKTLSSKFFRKMKTFENFAKLVQCTGGANQKFPWWVYV